MRKVLVALGLAAVLAAPLRAQEVDVELVLAVDISRSMDIEELELQREGYIAALRDPEVIRAIRGGELGRIAVFYFEWAGYGTRNVLGEWTLIDGPETAAAFGEALRRAPVRAAMGTSISGAIDFAAGLFDGNGFEGLRRVIDISGDGPNNTGPGVTASRDAAVARGITINGLPLMLRRTIGPFGIPDLDIYYEDCVIGGPLSFVLPLQASAKFAETIRRKLILEVAGLQPPPAAREARVVPAQLGLGPAVREPRTDCLIGEKRRRRWMEGGGWDW